MDKHKKSVYLILMLALLASLVIGFREFLMTTIIEPVALLMWIGWRIASSVDQGTYWIILIVICTLLVVRVLAYSRDEASISAYNDSYRPPSRLESWKRLIEDSVLGKDENEQLHNRLKQLYISAITGDSQPNSKRTDDFIVEGKIFLPPAAHRYLFPPSKDSGNGATNSWPNKMVFLVARIRSWGHKIMPQDNKMIDEVLTRIENELEINNGE